MSCRKPFGVACIAALIAFLPPTPPLEGADKDPGGRFLLHGKDVVEDTETALRWQRDGKAAKLMNYFEATEYAKNLKLGGLTGWRLPTADELRTIFPATAAPFLNSGYNPDKVGEGKKPHIAYWTSLCLLGDDLDPKKRKERATAYLFHWSGAPAPNNGNGCLAYLAKTNVRCVRSYDAKGKVGATK